jgi:hypothetical protein
MPEMNVIYVDEAGFNLGKTRLWGRMVIGKMATVDVPGQRGANITMCPTISLVRSCRNARLVPTTTAFFCFEMTSTNNWCQMQKGNRREETLSNYFCLEVESV